MQETKLRGILIGTLIALAAIIASGLLWFFVSANGEQTGLGWYMFSFASGLTMIVLPCTLPLAFVVVPLVMKKGLVKGVGIALAFGIGVALTLSMYGVLAAIVGRVAIGTLAAPLEDVKNWVYFIAGIFALLFALGEIGLIKVRMPSYTGAAPAFIQKRGDYVKALMLGLFLGNIGVGCPHPATPLLLIEIASSANVLYGWTLFLVHAIGRVLPLLFLAMLALLGVNGLSWLVARKDSIERATGWAMVFVAGFILTLGLFTHDWYVNSGIHTWFETFTQEARFTGIIADNLNSDVVHSHGIEDGPGLFGLPLWLGNWVIVFLWTFPIWWWWARRRSTLKNSPAVRLERLQAQIDTLEQERRSIEASANLEELTTTTAIGDIEKQMDALEKQRRDAEAAVNYGELGDLKEPLARKYEKILLFVQRNFIFVLTLLLALTFIYVLPKSFLEQAGEMHHSESTPAGTPFSSATRGLPAAREPEIVSLNDGDTYTLTASIVEKEVGNRIVKMLAYNGMIPGPVLKVPQDAEITITVKNETDVATTLHSHGVRLDNRFDGVPGETQEPIGVGQTFTYTVKFPDAGAYWYHPHIREDYAQEHGLYGNYIVEPLDPNYYSPVNREIPLMVDDILFAGDAIEPFYAEYINFALLGRFGNEFLVNGESNFVIPVRQGEVIRFPVTNTANARTFNLSIPGVRMKRVGADASKYEREEFVNNFLISPAERVIVEAYFERPGIYKLINTTPDGNRDAMYFSVGEDSVSESFVTAFNTLRTNADVAAEIANLSWHFERPADKNILLSVTTGAGVSHNDHAHTKTAETAAHSHSTAQHSATGGSGFQWDDPNQSDRTNTSDNVSWKIIDTATGKENMDIDWRFRVGDMVKVRITNDPNASHVMQHPVHFHGQRFLIIARNGVQEPNRAWKDTALVAPGESIDILVEMSNPGVWMAHCHIAEHLHAGMMFGFRVEDQNGNAPGDNYRTQTGTAPNGAFTSEESVTNGIRVAMLPAGEGSVSAGVPTLLEFAIEDVVNGIPRQKYGGQSSLRVFGVSSDGNDSFVLYPTINAQGRFSAEHRFLRAGTYRVWSMFDDGTATRTFAHNARIVRGTPSTPTAQPAFSNNTIVGDYQVALAHTALAAGNTAEAQITITDVFGGGVALDPIEGDALEIDLVATDFSSYHHMHPTVVMPGETPSEAAPADDGHDHVHSSNPLPALARFFTPVALAHGGLVGAVDASATNRFSLTFPREGTYRLFVRFRPSNTGLPEGKVLTAVFNLRIPAAAVGTISAQNTVETDTAVPPYMKSRWWISLVTSLIFIFILCYGVKRYLEKI